MGVESRVRGGKVPQTLDQKPVRGGFIEVIGIGTADSQGLRKGGVVNLDSTSEAIRKAQEEAEQRHAGQRHIGGLGRRVELDLADRGGIVAARSEATPMLSYVVVPHRI